MWAEGGEEGGLEDGDLIWSGDPGVIGVELILGLCFMLATRRSHDFLRDGCPSCS